MAVGIVCLAVINLMTLNAMDVGRTAAAYQRLVVEEHPQRSTCCPHGPTAHCCLASASSPVGGPAAAAETVRQHQHEHQQLQQPQARQSAAARLAQVQRQAISRFWELLQDFVALDVAFRAWFCPRWRLTTRSCGCPVTCCVCCVTVWHLALVCGACPAVLCVAGFVCLRFRQVSDASCVS
jgi:hypothetical protein